MISLNDYWMGRDTVFKEDLTDSIVHNATDLVGKINALLEIANMDMKVASGWRPKKVNDSTKNSAKSSNHILGLAVDLKDPERKLMTWVLQNTGYLARIGLWIEHPQWTPTWVHLQSVPPRSGHLIYVPNLSPPSCPSLPEQDGVCNIYPHK